MTQIEHRVSSQLSTVSHQLKGDREQPKSRFRAVLFVRDLDNQPERREGLDQARAKHINLQPKLEIEIATADPG